MDGLVWVSICFDPDSWLSVLYLDTLLSVLYLGYVSDCRIVGTLYGLLNITLYTDTEH